MWHKTLGFKKNKSHPDQESGLFDLKAKLLSDSRGKNFRLKTIRDKCEVFVFKPEGVSTSARLGFILQMRSFLASGRHDVFLSAYARKIAASELTLNTKLFEITSLINYLRKQLGRFTFG